MEPLKDQFFNPEFYQQLAQSVSEIQENLNKKEFVSSFDGYEELELMDRMKQVAHVIHENLTGNYKHQIEKVKLLGPSIKGFAGMALPYYVEKYGLENYDLSIDALHYLTRFSSSEFAIRPFIKQEFQQTMAHLKKWATDENNHVRRLASEGSRPHLPWSFKLDEIIENPDYTKPILNQLQKDVDLYVKKSVGNHLNDISKDHPDWVIDFLELWDLTDDHSAWMAKRGVRTLIKNGFPRSFGIMGFEKSPVYSMESFKVEHPVIELGEEQFFSFELISKKQSIQKLNIDFKVYYCKKAGKINDKVFKLKELNLKGGESVLISKKHKFSDFSTRKHYGGVHSISILINGVEQEKCFFELKC